MLTILFDARCVSYCCVCTVFCVDLSIFNGDHGHLTALFFPRRTLLTDFDSRVQQIESPKRPTKKFKESTRRVSYSDSENYPPEDPQDMVETRKEKYTNMPKANSKKRSARDEEILELKRALKKEKENSAKKDEQLAQVSAVTTSRKKGPSEKDPMVKMIGQIVRKKVWRKWRFVLSPGQEHQVGQLVMDNLGEEYNPNTPEGKANRKNWLELYSEVVTKKVNSVRNYYASQLRKQCAMKWMKKHGKDALIPTESFLKFLKREDPADDEEKAHFVFIWDKCLDIVNGGKYWKPPGKFYYVATFWGNWHGFLRLTENLSLFGN